MTLTANMLAERRSLMRSRSVWRVLALVLAVVAALGVLAGLLGGFAQLRTLRPHVAEVEISGFIGNDAALRQLLDDLGEDEGVRAVILTINSPGGSTAGGEALYEAIRRLAAQKPVVAEIQTLGTSAAYMAAIGTERIFALRSSITASIGVLFQFAEASRLLETIGVSVGEVRSGLLKAQPSPFGPPSEEALAEIEALVNATYDWFVDIVVERRGVTPAFVRGLEGGVLIGSQALESGLVDEIGGREAVRAWLSSTHDIRTDLPVVLRHPDNEGPLAQAMGAVASLRGESLELTLQGNLNALLRDALALDGLLSVWHVQALD